MKLIEELARRPKRAVRTTEVEVHERGESGEGMGLTQTSSTPNIFGGYDEYHNGTLVSSSRPNIFGGFDKSVFSLHGPGDGDAIAHAESALVEILAHHICGHEGPSNDAP